MTTCERLAAYVARASWDGFSPEARGKMRQHVLDSLGCATGAIGSGPMAAIAAEHTEWGLTGPCSLIGGGTTTPERAAFYNGALVRHLDFMDTFLASGEACHPSDNLAGILAAAELAGAAGREFLTALAIAYHVQCRLTSSGVPITRKGFDHTIQLSISLACGMSRVLGLSKEQTAHAIALCAASGLSVVAPNTGERNQQGKGLASAATAFTCIHNVRLASKGITGPLHVFEGPLRDILGKDFGIDWDNEDYDGILACSIKRYNAEFHAQTAIEAVLELRKENGLEAADVHGIQVDIFKAGFDLLGGGKQQNSRAIANKEDADRSLPYLMAVAMIDGEVSPKQFEPRRVGSEDVQRLLPQVSTWLSLAYTRDYPDSMRCKVRVGLKDGRIFELEKADYQGFFRRPMAVEDLLAKYKQLTGNAAPEAMAQRVIESIARIEQRPVAELTAALRNLQQEATLELVGSSSARA